MAVGLRFYYQTAIWRKYPRGITKRRTGPENGTENGTENGMENGTEKGMETLTGFLDAHWQLVITCITKRRTGLEAVSVSILFSYPVRLLVIQVIASCQSAPRKLSVFPFRFPFRFLPFSGPVRLLVIPDALVLAQYGCYFVTKVIDTITPPLIPVN